MIDSDEIRKKMAIEHNILLDKDDPILVAASVNETILIRYVEILGARNEQYAKELINSFQRGNAEAKMTGGRVITEATDYVSNQVKLAVTAALEEGREEIKKDLRLAWRKIEAARKVAFIAAGISVICTFLTVTSMIA